MENDFVPSYKNEEERLRERKKNKKIYRSKIVVLTIVIIAVITVLSVLGYTLANINYSKYESFEKKMNIYGFSQVYDNSRANTRDKVTKSEAIKMILSCLYNVPEIDGIALPTNETYSNAIWVEYAIKQGIVSREEVNSKNADDKVKYQEVLVWFYNVKAKILDLEPDTSENFNVKDINAYNTDQRLAIFDLLNSNVIVTNTGKINGNEKLYKGKLNELIVNFAEKYNTITVGNGRININEEKIPNNADMYPYTLASVQKDVYEIDFVNNEKEGFISPIEYYPDNKQYYTQVKNYVEGYYNYILSVDYNNISVEQMKRKLKKYAYEQFDEDVLNRYVEYVKSNNIKLSGTATVQLPCIYYDSENYRARVKLDFSVESSDTKENILFYDIEKSNVEYNGKQFTIYIDSILSKNELSETLYVKNATISSMMIKSNSSIVSKGV